MTAQRNPLAPVTEEAEACVLLRAPRPSSWYAVHVLSHAEFVVEDALESYGIEVFLPTWSEQSVWSDREKTITRPLFPGYLFARGSALDLAVLRIAGIIKLLPNNLMPEAVDGAQILNVRRALATRLPASPCPYVTGDEVLIDKGPMAGVKGIVLRTKRGTEVIVRIEMLHRGVSVSVPAADVLKATT